MGLEYRRNRYYDPKSGRFTQEDPIGLGGGLNLYGFGGGDPVNYSDPFGLCTIGTDCWDAFKEWFHGWLHRDDGHFFEHFKQGMRPAAQSVNPAMLEGAGGIGEAAVASERAIPEIAISRGRYPGSVATIEEAQAAGKPSILTIDRAGAAS